LRLFDYGISETFYTIKLHTTIFRLRNKKILNDERAEQTATI